MKRIIFLASIFLSIAGICTASVLILKGSPKVSSQKVAKPAPTIEIKWGEGSEAGVPDAAVNK